MVRLGDKHLDAMLSLLAAVVTAAVIVCSCTDDYLGTQEKEHKLQKITITTSCRAQTKTEVDLQKHILWQENDVLSIFSNTPETGNFNFTLKSGEGTSQAVFEGDALPTATFCALYPYNSSAVFNYNSESSTVSLHWDGSNQTAVMNSFDPSKALMAGCSNGQSLQFWNLCSFVKITTDFECKRIEFYSPEYNLAQDEITISYLQSKDSVVMEKATTHQQANPSPVAIVAPNDGTIAPGTYYIAVLPQHLYGFIIRVTTTQGATMTRNATDSKYWCELKPGVILNLGTFTASSFDGGDGFLGSGTTDDPYLIGTRLQFNLLREKLNTASTMAQFKNKHYKQTADIDFHGDTTNLMGSYLYQDESFTGSYNGDGHKLRNIVLKKTAGHYQYGNCHISALFCNVWNAKISNLTIECKGFEYDTDKSVAMYGGFVGVAESSDNGCVIIENCTFRATSEFSQINVGEQQVNYGGFIGQNQSNLKLINCTNEVPVDISSGLSSRDDMWEYSFGGLIGKSAKAVGDDYHLNIINCRNNADIQIRMAPTNCHAGGIIGYVLEEIGLNDATLRLFNVINRGNIAACCNSRSDDSFSGGLIGKHDSDGGDCGDPIIVNCMNSGGVSGAGDYAYAGGIMGWCYDNDTRICSCANVGSVYVDDSSADTPRCGALCGNPEGEYYNCAFTSGSITYGRSTSDSHIHNAYSIDSYPPLQLSGEKMNQLYESVPQSLRSEITSGTGATPATWSGLWNHQNQQGLDMIWQISSILY